MITLKKLFTHKKFIFFELGVLFFITLNKQFFSHENYQIRIVIYFLCLLYVPLVSYLIGINRKKLGITPKKSFSSLNYSLLSVLFLGTSLMIIYFLWPALFKLNFNIPPLLQIILRIAIYVIISVPVQEFIFRGYIISRLEKLMRNRWLIIFFSALIFGLVHYPFGFHFLTVATFFMGLILADNFLRYRNLYLSMGIHSLLGLFLVYFVVK